MKIDGGCHCGAVRYEAEIDPERVTICHCTDCQVLSGSAYRVNIRVDEADLRLLSGSTKTYVKVAESGNRRAQVFCPHCGTPIYATSVGDGPKRFALRVGTIRQRAELPPRRRVWCRSALPWSQDLGGLAVVDME